MEPVTLQAQNGHAIRRRVRSCVGRSNRVPEAIRVFVSKRGRRDPHPAYFFCTDLPLSARQVFEQHRGHWRCAVDNWFLKEQLRLADYRVHALDAILKYHAVVFMSLAWLRWRRSVAVRLIRR